MRRERPFEGVGDERLLKQDTASGEGWPDACGSWAWIGRGPEGLAVGKVGSGCVEGMLGEADEIGGPGEFALGDGDGGDELVGIFGRELAIGRVSGDGFDGFDFDVPLLRVVHDVAAAAEDVVVVLDLGVGHEVEDAGLLVGPPCGGAQGVEGGVEVEFGGEGLVGGAVREKEGHVLVELGLELVNTLDIRRGDTAVYFELGLHLFAGFAEFAMMVDELDGLFEADGDEQTDTDGGDVDEKVAPGVDGFVGGVDVEHGRVLCGDWRSDAAQCSDGPGCWFENECIAGRCELVAWLRMKP
jgi:hypothetical protein